MIAAHRSDSEVFQRALGLIEDSGVAAQIEELSQARRGAGGRRPAGIVYSLTAVLVAIAVLIDSRTTPSLTAAHRLIAFTFDDAQLAALGMRIDETQRTAVSPRRAWDTEYKRFMAWLSRQVAVLDSEPDQPARRVSNAEDRQRRASRTAEQVTASEAAAEHCRRLCNRIIAASVRDPNPDGYAGDVVVDETIFDVAKPADGVGARPDANRSAVSAAGFYVRADGVVQEPGSTAKVKRVDKVGFGVGVTAVIRVGKPSAIRRVVPVITAVDMHRPTAASLQGLTHALHEHEKNGFDPRTAPTGSGRNSRWPFMTVDMGYNPLDGFAELLIQRKYSMLAAYPKHWTLVSQAEHPRGRSDVQEPGPIVGHGDVYCPAAERLLRQGPMVVRTRGLNAAEVRAKDQRLSKVLPLLMGTNSRIKTAAAGVGRPRRDDDRPPAYKVDVVCPAVQGRVRCPLKPDSLQVNPSAVPTVDPQWDSSEFRCCEKSQITITFTPRQLKQFQGGLTPGSWEHIHHFEAYRALTERQFSLLKSPHMTALDRLNFGPRREPMLKLILAIGIAVSNLRVQDAPNLSDVDSVSERLRRLERHLGRPPAKVPART